MSGVMPEGYGTEYARRVAEYAGAVYSDALRYKNALLEIEERAKEALADGDLDLYWLALDYAATESRKALRKATK